MPDDEAPARADRPPDPIMRWLVIATLACIAGCVVLLAVGGSSLVIGAGIVLGGTAFVLVLAMAFYAVGRSEDRARAEQQQPPRG